MKALLASIVALGFMMGVAHAEETMGEKASTAGNKAKHAMKKGANRMKEAVCMEGDLKCAAKKGEHRIEEGADSLGNKAKEMKDKVD